MDNIIVEEQVRPLTNIDEYNEYILYHLYKHINTEYCLLIQDHAFIINPDSWTNTFLEYDYIGSPWPWSETAFVTPFGEHIRVGNGGFSLRSKKLLEVPNKVHIPFKVAEQPDFYKMFDLNFNSTTIQNVMRCARKILHKGCIYQSEITP